jgi:hypothetical protein
VVGEKNLSHIYTQFVLKVKMGVVVDVASNVTLMVVSILKYEQMVNIIL